MDTRRAIDKARSSGLFAIVLLIISAYGSCREMKFKLHGKEAKGTVTSITEERREGRLEGYNIHYQYRDVEGKRTRSGWTTVPVSEVRRFAEGQEVLIEYLGADSLTSRIRGEETNYWPYVFLISVVLLVIEVARLLR